MSKSVEVIVTITPNEAPRIDWSLTWAMWEGHGGSVWDEEECDYYYAEDPADLKWSEAQISQIDSVLQKITPPVKEETA